MKLFQAGALITLAAVFSLACSSSEGENKTAAQNANQQSVHPDNDNRTRVVMPSNTNASAPADQSNANKAASGSKPAAKVNAVALYTAQKCTGCHGPDGKGKVKGAPNFTDAAWQQKESDADLIDGIKKGNVPKMPAYGSKLSEDEIRALVAYVRTFSGK
jgi:cbb3-type cytochrome c oxidase subunit III